MAIWERAYTCPKCGEFAVIHISKRQQNKKCVFCGDFVVVGTNKRITSIRKLSCKLTVVGVKDHE